jgi:hypothetical protein
MLEDPALQKLLAEFDDFGFRTGATAFAADVITKIDAPGATSDTYLIAIYNRPPRLSAEELAQKMEGWMERISALPVRDRLSSYSLVQLVPCGCFYNLMSTMLSVAAERCSG